MKHYQLILLLITLLFCCPQFVVLREVLKAEKQAEELLDNDVSLLSRRSAIEAAVNALEVCILSLTKGQRNEFLKVSLNCLLEIYFSLNLYFFFIF
jgi:hypothetical protein